MEIVIASGNAHKAEELAVLCPAGWRILTLKDLGLSVSWEESGATFLDNARIKAAAVRAHVRGDAIVLADDSGLEVDALDGRPGVHSARYAGENASDRDNVAKLLAELAGVEQRSARFVCQLVALDGDGEEHCFRGVCEGSIIDAPRGVSGFGYDPLFVPTGSRLTFAEMSPEEKNQMSHRSFAIKRMLAASQQCRSLSTMRG